MGRAWERDERLDANRSAGHVRNIGRIDALRDAIAAPVAFHALQCRARCGEHQFPQGAVGVAGVIDHHAQGSAGGEHLQDPRVTLAHHRPQRVVVRRRITAEPVDERDGIEHLLVQGLRVGVIAHRQIEAQRRAGRRRTERRRRLHREGARPSIQQQARDGNDHEDPARAPREPIDGNRADDGETGERHHPEARRHAQPVEPRQPHEPSVRRLVERPQIHDGRIGSQREHPHRERRQQIEAQHRPAMERITQPRQRAHQPEGGEQGERQGLVGARDRQQPDPADAQAERSVDDGNHGGDQQQREKHRQHPAGDDDSPRF